MKTVLVTGSKGFIGRRLITALDEIGFAVKSIDAEYFNEPNWQEVLKLRLENSNLAGVFHVGACSDTLEQNLEYMMTRNFEATKVISDWCSESNKPLIFSSSAANYGVNGLFPANLYGWSKYVAEQYVIKNHGIALRYFNVYGPGEENKGNMSSFIYQAFIKSLKKSKVFLFPKNPRRDFIYIEDVVSANIYAFINFTNLKKDYFEVSTGASSTFEEILRYFEIDFEYSDEKSIPVGYQFYTCGDSDKWMDGWSPRYTLAQGLKSYREYLVKNYKVETTNQ
jgi:ADP-L-glycero-D-manno-heptose 6-epimerase